MQVQRGVSGGTSIHMAGELFGSERQRDPLSLWRLRPGCGLMSLAGGDMDVMFDNLPHPCAADQVRQLKALAVTSAQRSALPDDITVEEMATPALKGFRPVPGLACWHIMLTDIVHQQSSQVMNTPAIRKSCCGRNTERQHARAVPAYHQCRTQNWAGW
jgi:hypothetical protein